MDFHKVLSDPLFSVGSTRVSVGQALAVVATLIVTILLARAARQLTIRHFELDPPIAPRLEDRPRRTGEEDA